MFVNGNVHPKLYKVPPPTANSNQNSFHHSLLKEIMMGQREIKHQFGQSVKTIDQLLTTSMAEQTRYFGELKAELTTQEVAVAKISDTIQKDQVMNQVVLEQLTNQSKGLQTIAARLGQLEEVSNKLTSQSEFNEQVLEKLDVHENSKRDIMERMDGQEALTLKMSRQLDDLRAIIFERASFIVEKTEAYFKQSAGFFLKGRLKKSEEAFQNNNMNGT